MKYKVEFTLGNAQKKMTRKQVIEFLTFLGFSIPEKKRNEESHQYDNRLFETLRSIPSAEGEKALRVF